MSEPRLWRPAPPPRGGGPCSAEGGRPRSALPGRALPRGRRGRADLPRPGDRRRRQAHMVRASPSRSCTRPARAAPSCDGWSNEAQILQELSHDNVVELLGFVQARGPRAPTSSPASRRGAALAQHVERLGPLSPLRERLDPAPDPARARRGAPARRRPPRSQARQRPARRPDAGEQRAPTSASPTSGSRRSRGGWAIRLTRMGAFVGTPEYAAPEQFEGHNPTPATDVFAAGARCSSTC